MTKNCIFHYTCPSSRSNRGNMTKVKYKENIADIQTLESQINNIEKCINDLNNKLRTKQKLLKDLQNYQNLVNLLHYNLLSKETDVKKISDGLKKIIDSATVVINKLPPELQKQIKDQVKTTKEQAVPVIDRLGKQIESHIKTAKDKMNQGASQVEEKFKEVRHQASMEGSALEAKYKEYKLYCEKQGEKIASKEEFKQIMAHLKNFKAELQEVKMYEIINQLNKDMIAAKGSVLSAMLKVTETVQSYIEKAQKSAAPPVNNVDDAVKAMKENAKASTSAAPASSVNKQDTFKAWVEAHVSIVSKKSEYTSYSEFYDKYQAYLSESNLEEQSLSKSHFTQALSKNYPKIKIVEGDTKAQKLISAKLK